MKKPTAEQQRIILNVGARARRRGLRAQGKAERLFSSQLSGDSLFLADFRSKRAVRIATQELQLAARVDDIAQQWDKKDQP